MTPMIEQSPQDALQEAATAPLDPHVIVLFGVSSISPSRA